MKTMTLQNQFARWTPWSPPMSPEKPSETTHDAYRLVRVLPTGDQVVGIEDSKGAERLYLAHATPGEQLTLTPLDKDGEAYIVAEIDGRMVCSCPSYRFRCGPAGKICKHGRAARAGLLSPF
jgi:hypothetical protein